MFSVQLKQLRRSRNMSQSELAERLSVSQQTVAKWESGQVFPKLPMLTRLSQIFGISVDSLVGQAQAVTENDVIAALFGEVNELTTEMYEDVKKYVEFLKIKENVK